MEVQNSTPFRFGCLIGRLPFPGHSLTLLVKGTFDLRPGHPAVLSEQQIYPTGDEYERGDEERQGGPRYSTDFVFLKERADLLLAGRCHAPGGRPTAVCNVAFQVGDLRRTLLVTGDRYWIARDGRWLPTGPEPFTTMPLRYEMAFGGEGFDPNPVGKGAADISTPDGRVVRPLPNIEDPEAFVRSPDDCPSPVGFGPLHPGWEARQAKLGTYGGDYVRTRWPWFAEGLEWGQFNAAPPGLQFQGYLRGDEGLVFENMHPEHPVYASALPGLRARCFVNRTDPNGGGSFEEVGLGLDTLWVDMEAERLVLVWRGWTQVASPEHEDIGHVYIASESMAEVPGSLAHHGEGFGSMLAARDTRRGDEPASAADTGTDPGEGTTDEEPGPGADASPKGDAATDATEALDPKLQRAIDEARPHFTRLGIDPAEIEVGNPEVVVPRILEILQAELRDHGIDPDKPPELTPEQKQYQASVMAELGIPWNVSTGLPDLEGFDPESPEPIIEEQLAKLKADLQARGLDPDEPREPTPEQKAQLARMGIDFDTLKRSLEGAPPGDGESGGAEEEEEPSPEWVRDRVKRGESLAGADLRGLDLSGSILPGANLAGALLAGASLGAADLEAADLRGANLEEADLRGAKLVGARLDEADLTLADLTGADLTEATLDGVSGEAAVLQEAKMDRCSASGAILRGGTLRKIRAQGACFDGADLTEADLEDADLSKASLRGTRLNGASAPRANLARADITGLRAAWGARFSGASLFQTEGSGSMWMESDLTGADFRWARLESADFTGAVLTGAGMYAADLPRARFRKANLAGATVTQANLFEGSFEKADLTGTDLRGSNLFAVEFLDATLSETMTDRANLKRTKLVLEDGKP